MAIKLTAESFLNVVKQSGLIEQDQLKRHLWEFRDKGIDVESSRAIADQLIEVKAITSWQAEKLLHGKHKGFFLGKYRLYSLLGKGGMSSVYLAEHVLMRRRCAIKVLPSKRVKDSSYLARFHREAQAVASLDHPNIVRAYDVDQEVEKGTEIHFLVMEHVDGCDLQEMIQKNGILNYEDAADYLRQAADGLHHAHLAGLVHRDIKPGNLLVDKHSNVVKILDLGLARFFNEDEENPLTVAHDEKVLGTADYLAPEQALDSHMVDIRADIYSLGCTIYYCLTGHPPFTEGTLAQRLMWHQTKQPPPIKNDRPDVPDSLVVIIEKMMEKKPEDRQQTAADVSEAFAAWLVENASDEWKQQHPGIVGSGSGKDSGSAIAATVAPSAPPTTAAGEGGSTVTAAAPQPATPVPAAPADEGFAAFLTGLDSSPAPAAAPQTPAIEPQETPPATAPAPPPPEPVNAPAVVEVAQHPQPTVVQSPVAPTPAVVAEEPPLFPSAPAVASPVEAVPAEAQPPVVVAEEPPLFPSAPAVASPVEAVPAEAQPPVVAAEEPPLFPSAPAVASPVEAVPAEAQPPAAVAEEPPLFPSAPAVASPVEAVPAEAQPPVVVAEEPPLFPSAPAVASPVEAVPAEAQPPVVVAEEPPLFPSAPAVASPVEAQPAVVAAAVQPPAVVPVEAPPVEPPLVAPVAQPVQPTPVAGPVSSETVASQPETPPTQPIPTAPPVEATPVVAEAATAETIVTPPTPQPAQPVPAVETPLFPGPPESTPVATPVAAQTPAEPPMFPSPPAESTPQEAAPFANFGEPAQPAVPVATAAPVATEFGGTAPAEQPAANVIPEPAAAAMVSGPTAPDPTTTSSLTARKKRSSQQFPLVPTIAGAAVVLIGLVGYMVFNGDDSSSGKSKDKQKVAKKSTKKKTKKGGSASANGSTKLISSELSVGAGGFGTISEALAYVKKNKSRFSRKRDINIKVAAGTYRERIVLDDSRFEYPKTVIRLFCEDGAKVVLQPSGSEPIIQLSGDVKKVTIEGFELIADNRPVAIQLAGYVEGTVLKNLKVKGFTQAGVRGLGPQGFGGGYGTILFENIDFHSGSPAANGIELKPGKSSSPSQIRIQGCRFFGPMAAGVLVDADTSNLEVRESIFTDLSVGIKFNQANRNLQDIEIGNNSFYKIDRGLVFSNMPAAGSSGFQIAHNLFSALKGPEAVIENDYTEKEFYSIFSTNSGSISNNWSDRKVVPDPKKGEHNIIVRPKTERVDSFLFVSTNPTNVKYLAPAPNSQHKAVPAAQKSFKPYVGAVAP